MEHFSFEGKRILEVGCGIGLSSLLLNVLHADITATDIHPLVAGFLAENTRLNNSDEIPFLRTGWKDACDGLGKFDVIIGADVLYEPDHIALLSAFIDEHARPVSEVILVDPGRPHQNTFSKSMVARGYEYSGCRSRFSENLADNFRGKVLRYRRGGPVDEGVNEGVNEGTG